MVFITASLVVAPGQSVVLQATIGSASPPGFIIGRVSLNIAGMITTVLPFLVPAGYFYRAVDAGLGTATLIEWLEVEL